MCKIDDIAEIIRTKNSGPFELTCDIIFKNQAVYQKAKDSQVLTPEKIARLYGVPLVNIVTFVWFDVAYALKFTMLRGVSSGSKGERDTYGAQQNVPVLSITFPFES